MELLDTVGIKAPGCLASFILTDVPIFRSKVIQKTRFSSSQNENGCPFVCGFVCIPS